MDTFLTILAFLIVAVQLGYFVFFWTAFSRKGRKQGNSYSTPVSVIVCAHDEENNLRELIPILLSQDYPSYEVIIVEDRCNDGTYDLLLDLTRQNPKVKMVRVQHLPAHVNGKKYALTLGIKAATHDWVLLTDADCRPMNTHWVSAMASYCQTGCAIVLGYSPYFRVKGLLNSFIRFEALMTAVQFMGFALAGKPYMGTGRNLCYTRKLFLDNKGFHKHLNVTGGDDDLFINEHANSSNTAVAIGTDTLTRSYPKTSWKEFIVQKIRHLSAGKHYKMSDRFALGLFSMSWILTLFFVLPYSFFSLAALYLWIGLALREFLLIMVTYRASRTLGEPFEGWKSPLLDFIYAIYYLGTGLVASGSKQVRWKI